MNRNIDHIEFSDKGPAAAFIEARKSGKKVFVLMLLENTACNKWKPFVDFLNTQQKTKEILSREWQLGVAV